MSTSRKIVRNTTFMLTSEIVAKLGSLIIMVLIARYLGSEGFGKFSFIFAFVGTIMILGSVGENFIVIREIARKKEAAIKYFGNSLTLKSTLLVLAIGISVIIINIIEPSTEIKLAVYIASLGITFLFLSHLYWAVLQAYEAMHFESIMKILERILLFILIYLIYIMRGSLIQLVLMFTIVYFVSFVFSFLFVTFKVKYFTFQFNPSLIKEITIKGLPFAFTAILMTFYFRIDTLMLSLIKTYTDVGIYNASYKIVEGLSAIPIMIVLGVFPAMSRLFIENKGHLKLLYRKAFKYLFMLALPIAVGSTLLSNKIILFIYKEGFSNSSIVLKILVWAEIFIFLNYLMGYLLNSINKQKWFMYSTGICVILNIILNFILIPKLSYIGASIATVITQFTNLLILYILTSKEGYKFNIFKLIARPVIGCVLMTSFLYFINGLHILTTILLSSLIYFGTLFFLGAIGKEETALITSLFKKNS